VRPWCFPEEARDDAENRLVLSFVEALQRRRLRWHRRRIHGHRRRGVGVERAPRRLTCRGDSAAIWPAIVASSRRRSASSRAVSLLASSAMRASHSASASGVMRLIRVPGISSSLGPRPRFFNLCYVLRDRCLSLHHSGTVLSMNPDAPKL
jgi:hypothetical protein